MKRITNLTGGQFVCSLADESTLRIDYKSYADIKDENLTPYLDTAESKGLVKIETIGDAVVTVTATKKSSAKAVKEE